MHVILNIVFANSDFQERDFGAINYGNYYLGLSLQGMDIKI
jgi:hypothetical protein